MKAHDVMVPDASAGLPFEHAMTYYGNRETAQQYKRFSLRRTIKHGTPGALTEQELPAMEAWRLALVEDQLFRLRSGAEYATGFRDGSMLAEQIPPTWWQKVKVDLDKNAAEAHGMRISGISVYAAKGSPTSIQATFTPARETQKRRGPKPVERKRVAQLMQADIDSGKRTIKDLRAEKVEALPLAYNTSRATAQAALLEIVANSNSDK